MLKKDFLIAMILLSSLTAIAQEAAPEFLLNHYRPRSIYRIPVNIPVKAKYPIIDIHSHAYAETAEQLDQWVKMMDQAGIQKTIVQSFATGHEFDSIYQVYARYKDRFEIWCGFDYTGYNDAGWASKAVKELERCYRVGARGVGELGDKGLGELYSRPTPAYGMHIDDPRMELLLKKCGELKMPVSIHVAEPIWMYEPIDSTNDGLMNAAYWKIDKSKQGFIGHAELIATLENAVRKNPQTTFIACHFANCEYDLEILGKLLDKYKNLYADIAARYGETAPIPRYMNAFYKKHQDKLLYGTDLHFNLNMYRTTFRILETNDEHFYEPEFFRYHWPLHGFGLEDAVLKKLYRENALKVLNRN